MSLEATALAVIEMARHGQFAEIRDKFAPQLQPMVPAEALRAAWEAEIARHGAVSALGTPVPEPAGPGMTVVKVPVTFARDTMTVAVGLAGEDGGESWITGIQLLPAGAAEPVAPWAPPHDQDETIGRNKPVKDLAWGLATAGIAVLRFEKVTHAHPAQIAGDASFTLTDEYVPHAVAAIRLLRGHQAVDPERVFLAGHSQGGSVAPRVAARAPVAGLVIIAGGAQPLHQAMLRQFRYLAGRDPAQAATLDMVSRQVAAVDDPALSAATPDSELPFGIPAAYWLDARGYDPAAAAAALGKPVLIVQGGRDYQVTVADDLSRWRAALDGRPDVTIRVYPADNHLFFSGEGPSSPAEYEPAQHVDPAVVADIAAWLSGARPGAWTA